MTARADLLLQCPTNLSLPPGVGAAYVDGDMYDICQRVREIDENLRVVVLTGQEKRYTHAIMEHCGDGVERLIFKVGPADQDCPLLDGRVVEKLRRLAAQPLAERLRRFEAEETKYEADQKEHELEKIYENLGRPMWTQLEHDGFIQRSVSYPKLGVATAGKRAR